MIGAAQPPGGVDVYTSREIKLSNVAFVEILGFDLEQTHRGGVIRVTGQVIDSSALGTLYTFACADIRIVGFLSAGVETLHRAAIAGDAAPIDYRVPRDAPYKRIAVLARLLLDATPLKVFPPGGAPMPQIVAGAVARMARS